MLHYYHAFLPPHFHLWNIPFIFIAGLVGESFGALVGGGSIVTMPALLLMGLPLPEAEQRARSLRHNLAQRNIHPDVLKFCKAELLQDNYFHAVFEATKSVADKIRQEAFISAQRKVGKRRAVRLKPFVVIYYA